MSLLKKLLGIGADLAPDTVRSSGPPAIAPPAAPAPIAANPWDAVRRSPATWDIAAMYDAARGEPVSKTTAVAFCLPKYRESGHVADIVRGSLDRIEDDLHAHGVATGHWKVTGESLIQRCRMRLAHCMLKSIATHMLFCDGDIEALDPTCVRKMLATGYDVIAGACPYKNPTGNVVCNLWPEQHAAFEDGAKLSFPKGCIEVRDAGTGFMLISRRALVRLMEAHPELIHWSRDKSDYDEPLWALFDTGIVDGVYQSEDFMFCRLWQALGEKVYVYIPATFRHWGEHGYEGSFAQQYGLVARPKAGG